MEEQGLQRIPESVAIILDGNGRWAERHGVPKSLGHAEGCKTLEQIVYDAADIGIKVLTVYGFSTENWKRDQLEVGALMTLFRYYVKRLYKVAMEKNVRVRIIGDKSRFAEDLVEDMEKIEEATKDNDRMTFVAALNYGARDEIARAVRGISMDVASGRLSVSDISESLISERLDTAGLPDPDLLIRTSGEMRLSNYLLWQLAYTEIYVTDTLWPDFHKEELLRAVEEYGKRDRRFGGRKK
ncbi:MAG: di-trans,poly-cis-decaprenylcistransferase [Lachnospiraceae bacterium]|nr:di-trans,poly-cis-decaprenylcistransferase [Lachnospiraceae bacterium]